MKLNSYYLKWMSTYKNDADRRLELLREAKDAIEHGYYSRTLIKRIEEELGDD